jgi:hypothetical protein
MYVNIVVLILAFLQEASGVASITRTHNSAIKKTRKGSKDSRCTLHSICELQNSTPQFFSSTECNDTVLRHPQREQIVTTQII